MITKDKFLKDVAAEVRAIKKIATPSEISRLDFETFDPSSKFSCVYGQMTGNCRSERAEKLINTCCKRIFNIPTGSHKKVFSWVKKGINGKEPIRNTYVTLSLLETYILTNNANNENIISYLKGKTKKLIL